MLGASGGGGVGRGGPRGRGRPGAGGGLVVGARAGSLREGAARPSGTWAKGKKAPQKAGLGPCGGCRACLEKGLEGGPCPATRARGSVRGRGCGGETSQWGPGAPGAPAGRGRPGSGEAQPVCVHIKRFIVRTWLARLWGLASEIHRAGGSLGTQAGVGSRWRPHSSSSCRKG